MASVGRPVPRPDSLMVGEGQHVGAHSLVPRKDSVLNPPRRSASADASGEAAAAGAVNTTDSPSSSSLGSPVSPMLSRVTPAPGDADWQEEYAFTGGDGEEAAIVAEGRKLATLARRTTAANPWRSVKNKSVRMKRLPSSQAVQMLDLEARQRPWYCLDIERDNAIAMLENLQHRLPEGSFVLCNSRREFAMLTLIAKSNLLSVAVDADPRSMWLKLAGVKKPPRFPTVTALIHYYASKKQKGMPAKLRPDALEQVLEEVMKEGSLLPAEGELVLPGGASEAYVFTRDEGALANPGYYHMSTRVDADTSVGTVVTAPPRDAGMMNPGYIGPATPTGAHALRKQMGEYREPVPRGNSPDGGYVMLDAGPGLEGYIQISKTPFTEKDGIKGVTFQPCQKNEWFFMGLSAINQNHHGRRDQHYDDIDYCIGVMGNGKATARENEDEVGPYIDYNSGDTFTIRVNIKKNSVEFAKNKKIFHTSFMPASKLPLHALQAFHPINGGQLLIQNSSWLYK